MRRRIPCVRQMEDADCGAACLAMVLGAFGKQVGLDELREMTGTGRDGVDARSLLQAARAYGLHARGVRADVDALRDLPQGSVLHWEFSHFVVLERVVRRGVRIVDPGHGRRLVPFDEVRRAYTGVAMVFEPGEDLDRSGSPAKGTWRYLRPILRQPRTLTRVIATSVVIRVLALAVPLLTAVIVDDIVPREDRHLLVIIALGLAVVVGYQFVASLIRGNLLLELRTHLDLRLTMGFVDHLVELPYAFFMRRSSGDLMMRLQSNTNVREILTTGSMSALLDGTFAIAYLGLLFVVSVPIGLLVLIIALLQTVTLLLSWRRNQRLMSESLQVQARTQSYAYELLAGIETLKAAGAQQRAAEHWAGLYVDQVNVDVTRGRLTALVESVMSTLQIAAPLLILVGGTFQVMNGELALGSMLAATALAAGFLQPLATLVNTGLQAQVLASYMERINDVLDTPREQHGERRRPVTGLDGRVCAEHVSFAYSPLAPMVVSGVSLDVRPGEHVGIVGRSGSGKSTLAHLLLGLYPPTSGRISYDGIDLAELDASSVRQHLGIVTQHPYLFASTIRENIALTNPGLPLSEVEEAARLACIHDDIAAMPMGYETRLHDGGASLSGGQRQRLALARALVHRPSILLLDEATSDLDTVTEQMVYENLATLSCTTIVIAHRLSTIRNADRIVVMDEGTIVESGTHDELLGLTGTYHDLVHAQASVGAPAPASVPPASPPAVPAPPAPRNAPMVRQQVNGDDGRGAAAGPSPRAAPDPPPLSSFAATSPLARAIADHLELKQRHGRLTDDEARLRDLLGGEPSRPLAEASRPR